MKRLRILALVLAVLTIFSACGSRGGDTSHRAEPRPEPTLTPAPAPAENSRKMTVPELAEYVQKRTVRISVQLPNGTSTGSGFFIDDEGTVVTNYHVIDGAENITVEMYGGGVYQISSIVDFYEMYDLAVLKIDYSGNDYLELSDAAPKTGEEAYAAGSPLGFLDNTFSNGIVSNSSRMVGAIHCIQTTAAISNGNSGGPLVNADGEVIGINSYGYTAGENLNLAIKVDELDRLGMDKNWPISRYKEWYKKEIERSYILRNYSTNTQEQTKINTYQHVTGRECSYSSKNWSFLSGNSDNFVRGYADNYGIYIYEYDVNEFDQYTEYLNDNGFTFDEGHDYTEGISYFYENSFSGEKIDVFIMDGEEFIVIEAYKGVKE